MLHRDLNLLPGAHLVFKLCSDELRIVYHAVVVDVVVAKHGVDEEGELIIFVMRRENLIVVTVTV